MSRNGQRVGSFSGAAREVPYPFRCPFKPVHRIVPGSCVCRPDARADKRAARDAAHLRLSNQLRSRARTRDDLDDLVLRCLGLVHQGGHQLDPDRGAEPKHARRIPKRAPGPHRASARERGGVAVAWQQGRGRRSWVSRAALNIASRQRSPDRKRAGRHVMQTSTGASHKTKQPRVAEVQPAHIPTPQQKGCHPSPAEIWTMLPWLCSMLIFPGVYESPALPVVSPDFSHSSPPAGKPGGERRGRHGSRNRLVG